MKDKNQEIISSDDNYIKQEINSEIELDEKDTPLELPTINNKSKSISKKEENEKDI
jgi:hypothetical protein